MPKKVNRFEVDVKELESILEAFHTKECWQQTQAWFSKFEDNYDEKANFLESIIYCKDWPLVHSSELEDKGISSFNVLQGDIIKTKAALTNHPIFNYEQEEYSFYIVVPSSCSIQPKKYKWILLARLWPIEQSNIKELKSAYYEALNLKNNKLFFLPSISGLDVGEFGFLAVLEEVSYIENAHLQTCIRVASLTTLGWHLFNAFIVNHFTRPSGDDLKIRKNSSSAPDKWSWSIP